MSTKQYNYLFFIEYQASIELLFKEFELNKNIYKEFRDFENKSNIQITNDDLGDNPTDNNPQQNIPKKCLDFCKIICDLGEKDYTNDLFRTNVFIIQIVKLLSNKYMFIYFS